MSRDNDKRDLKRLVFGDARNLTFAALLCLSLVAGGTLAYYSASSNVASNDFTTVSAPSPAIVENDEVVDGYTNPAPKFEDDGSGTYVANKKVQIQNNGDKGFLRVRLTLPQVAKGGSYDGYDMGSVSDNGFVAPSDNKVTVGDYTLEFWTDGNDDWSQHWAYKDGWFYYKKLMPASGEADNRTAPLLARVTTTKQPDADAKLEVGVIAETLEYYNNVTEVNRIWSTNYDSSGNWQ